MPHDVSGVSRDSPAIENIYSGGGGVHHEFGLPPVKATRVMFGVVAGTYSTEEFWSESNTLDEGLVDEGLVEELLWLSAGLAGRAAVNNSHQWADLQGKAPTRPLHGP